MYWIAMAGEVRPWKSIMRSTLSPTARRSLSMAWANFFT